MIFWSYLPDFQKILFSPFSYFGVYVHCCTNISVSHYFLYNLNVRLILTKSCAEGMPEVMDRKMTKKNRARNPYNGKILDRGIRYKTNGRLSEKIEAENDAKELTRIGKDIKIKYKIKKKLRIIRIFSLIHCSDIVTDVLPILTPFMICLWF